MLPLLTPLTARFRLACDSRVMVGMAADVKTLPTVAEAQQGLTKCCSPLSRPNFSEAHSITHSMR